MNTHFTALLLALSGIAGAPGLAFAATDTPAEGDGPIDIRLVKAKESGAIFVERFDGDALNRDLWQIVDGDTGIQVEVGGGELRIHGRTGPEAPKAYNHVGLFGKVFRESNVVTIARVRAAHAFEPAESGPPFPPGQQLLHVHLCGANPDYNSAVCYGVNQNRVGWIFWVRDWDRMKIRGETLEPGGKESEEFTPVRVEHLNGESKGFVFLEGAWKQVGETRRTAHGAGRLELKVTIGPRDQETDMRAADALMYLHPRVAPARFIVTNDWIHTIPRLGEYRGKPLRMEIREADSDAVLGAADIDNNTGEFAVTLDEKRAYPVAAKVAILHEGKVIARTEIKNADLDGLYPGDVYSLLETAGMKEPPGRR